VASQSDASRRTWAQEWLPRSGVNTPTAQGGGLQLPRAGCRQRPSDCGPLFSADGERGVRVRVRVRRTAPSLAEELGVSLALGLLAMPTGRARPAGGAGGHQMHGDAAPCRLVGEGVAQGEARPGVPRVALFATHRGGLWETARVCAGEGLARSGGFVDQGRAYHVVRRGWAAGRTTAQRLHAPLCVLGAPLLEGVAPAGGSLQGWRVRTRGSRAPLQCSPARSGARVTRPRSPPSVPPSGACSGGAVRLWGLGREQTPARQTRSAPPSSPAGSTSLACCCAPGAAAGRGARPSGRCRAGRTGDTSRAAWLSPPCWPHPPWLEPPPPRAPPGRTARASGPSHAGGRWRWWGGWVLPASSRWCGCACWSDASLLSQAARNGKEERCFLPMAQARGLRSAIQMKSALSGLTLSPVCGVHGVGCTPHVSCITALCMRCGIYY